MKRLLFALALLWAVPASAQFQPGGGSSGGGCTSNCTFTGNTTMSGTTSGTLTTWTNSSATVTAGFSPYAAADRELLFSTSSAGENILVFLNSSSSGFSANAHRGADLCEHYAYGFANPGTNYISGDGNDGSGDYIEVSSVSGVSNQCGWAIVTGASITGTTLTFATVSSGTPKIGQSIVGAANGTIITAGSGLTWTVTPSQSFTGGTTTTLALPPPTFDFKRSGLIDGAVFAVTTSMRIVGGADTSASPGTWKWYSRDGTNTYMMLADPVKNQVTVNKNLFVGVGNNGVTYPGGALDVYGKGTFGTTYSSARLSDCEGYVCMEDSAGGIYLSFIKSGGFKMTMQMNTQAGGLQIVDRDHSSKVVAGFASDNTALVSLGGALQIGGASLTLTSGALGMPTMTASGSAPGATGLKLEAVCGTAAGSLKLIVSAGTSATTKTIIDSIGSGVTGC